MFEGGYEKTAALAAQYRAMADFMKVEFFDAGSTITTDGCDGIHFTAQNNHDLGKALAAIAKDMLS
jgi:lysophospholipase L1-like esterase